MLSEKTDNIPLKWSWTWEGEDPDFFGFKVSEISTTAFEFDDDFWRKVKIRFGYFKLNNRVEDFNDLLLAWRKEMEKKP